jgi:hypothetical protein
MEIILAILFYLHLLMPGTSYTQSDINSLIQNNQQAITKVQSNSDLTKCAVNTYSTTTNKGIVEPWEEEQEPIQE